MTAKMNYSGKSWKELWVMMSCFFGCWVITELSYWCSRQPSQQAPNWDSPWWSSRLQEARQFGRLCCRRCHRFAPLGSDLVRCNFWCREQVNPQLQQVESWGLHSFWSTGRAAAGWLLGSWWGWRRQPWWPAGQWPKADWWSLALPSCPKQIGAYSSYPEWKSFFLEDRFVVRLLDSEQIGTLR